MQFKSQILIFLKASGYVDFYFAERTFKVDVNGLQGKNFTSEVGIKNTKPPVANRRAA